MYTTIWDIREPTYDFSKHKSMGSWISPWFCCSLNCFFNGLLWPLPNISVPRYSTRQAGPSWRGRLLQAKLMLRLQDDNSSFPALFSCSPCFVLAILSCAQRSKGCSRPLGIRTLWPCLQNISFSISVSSPACTDSGQSWGGQFEE